MSSFNNRKVTHAVLHQPIFVPAPGPNQNGLGQIGPTLARLPGKMADLVMSKGDDGLYIQAGGQEILVPLAQVQVMVFAKTEKK